MPILTPAAEKVTMTGSPDLPELTLRCILHGQVMAMGPPYGAPHTTSSATLSPPPHSKVYNSPFLQNKMLKLNTTTDSFFLYTTNIVFNPLTVAVDLLPPLPQNIRDSLV